MSLIEEALRRAQEEGQPSQRETPIHVQLPDPAPASEIAQEASSSPLNWAAIVTVATVVVLARIAWGRIVAPVVLRQPSQIVRAPAAAELTNHPSARRAFSPALTLNGVVAGSGQPLAIINNNVMGIGETIEGATLVAVTADAATLRWRDQELVLKTTE